MKRLIIFSSTQQKLSANQQVNRVGKYIYKNLDGAFKFKTSSNMCDVYITLLYEVPGSNDVQEMTLDLNITTYQNKLRVNIIELTPNERTLGYDLYLPEKLEDLEEAKKMILQKVIKRISKAYQDYNFLF